LSDELLPVSFHKIMQSGTYTVFMLGVEEKRFSIYTAPKVGEMIQSLLSDKPLPRPYTHELMNNIFHGLDIALLQMVIHDVEDTIYYARLFLEQKIGDKRHILELDSRPSDCLVLSLMNNIPIFCRREAYEKIIPLDDTQ
jgi:uncharacterized protein